MQGTVRIDAINTNHWLIDRFMAQITRIAEINASLFVDRNIVRGIQLTSLKQSRNDPGLAGLHVRLSHTATTVVGSFGHNHVASRVKFNAIRHTAR